MRIYSPPAHADDAPRYRDLWPTLAVWLAGLLVSGGLIFWINVVGHVAHRIAQRFGY